MVEYSEDFNERYTGAKATAQRALAILKCHYGVIPYVRTGIKATPFNLSSTEMKDSIIQALAPLGAKITTKEGRLYIADIEVPVQVLGGAQ